MKFNLAVKCAAIIAIAFGLLIFLQMIEYKVDERNQYRFQAKSTIAQGWSGSQIVVSPILRLTFSKDYDQEVFDKNLEKYVVKRKTKTWSELNGTKLSLFSMHSTSMWNLLHYVSRGGH